MDQLRRAGAVGHREEPECLVLDGGRAPPFCVPGTYVDGWTSIRKVKEGETTNNLFAFLTT